MMDVELLDVRLTEPSVELYGHCLWCGEPRFELSAVMMFEGIKITSTSMGCASCYRASTVVS